MLSLSLPQRALEKADASHIQEIELENSRLHKRLARLRAKLEDRRLSKEQAEAKHRQAQDQLQEMKSKFTRMTCQDSKAKAEGETGLKFGGQLC